MPEILEIIRNYREWLFSIELDNYKNDYVKCIKNSINTTKTKPKTEPKIVKDIINSINGLKSTNSNGNISVITDAKFIHSSGKQRVVYKEGDKGNGVELGDLIFIVYFTYGKKYIFGKMTINQWVEGSSPSGETATNKGFRIF